MPIDLTTFPAAAPFAVLAAFDDAAPDGPAKEIVARAAALGLIRGFADAGYLCHAHDLLAPVVEAAAKDGGGVVNAAVKLLLLLDAVPAPADPSAISDAVASLAGAVYDVVNHKTLAVTVPPSLPVPTPVAAAGGSLSDAAVADDELADLDLGSDQFGPLRFVLTRTFEAARPAVYAKYRALKDSGLPTAKPDAYSYAFGLLAKLIARAEGRYGPPC